jgi:hypothetical protein
MPSASQQRREATALAWSFSDRNKMSATIASAALAAKHKTSLAGEELIEANGE